MSSVKIVLLMSMMRHACCSSAILVWALLLCHTSLVCGISTVSSNGASDMSSCQPCIDSAGINMQPCHALYDACIRSTNQGTQSFTLTDMFINSNNQSAGLIAISGISGSHAFTVHEVDTRSFMLEFDPPFPLRPAELPLSQNNPSSSQAMAELRQRLPQLTLSVTYMFVVERPDHDILRFSGVSSSISTNLSPSFVQSEFDAWWDPQASLLVFQNNIHSFDASVTINRQILSSEFSRLQLPMDFITQISTSTIKFVSAPLLISDWSGTFQNSFFEIRNLSTNFFGLNWFFKIQLSSPTFDMLFSSIDFILSVGSNNVTIVSTQSQFDIASSHFKISQVSITNNQTASQLILHALLSNQQHQFEVSAPLNEPLALNLHASKLENICGLSGISAVDVQSVLAVHSTAPPLRESVFEQSNIVFEKSDVTLVANFVYSFSDSVSANQSIWMELTHEVTPYMALKHASYSQYLANMLIPVISLPATFVDGASSMSFANEALIHNDIKIPAGLNVHGSLRLMPIMDQTFELARFSATGSTSHKLSSVSLNATGTAWLNRVLLNNMQYQLISSASTLQNTVTMHTEFDQAMVTSAFDLSDWLKVQSFNYSVVTTVPVTRTIQVAATLNKPMADSSVSHQTDSNQKSTSFQRVLSQLFPGEHSVQIDLDRVPFSTLTIRLAALHVASNQNFSSVENSFDVDKLDERDDIVSFPVWTDGPALALKFRMQFAMQTADAEFDYNAYNRVSDDGDDDDDTVAVDFFSRSPTVPQQSSNLSVWFDASLLGTLSAVTICNRKVDLQIAATLHDLMPHQAHTVKGNQLPELESVDHDSQWRDGAYFDAKVGHAAIENPFGISGIIIDSITGQVPLYEHEPHIRQIALSGQISVANMIITHAELNVNLNDTQSDFVFANLEDGFTMHAFLASTVGVDSSFYPALLLAPFHTNTELSLAAHDIELQSVDANNVTQSEAFGYLSSEQPHIPAGFQLSGPLNVFGQQSEAQLRLFNARHSVSQDIALQYEIQVRIPRLEAGSCVLTGPNDSPLSFRLGSLTNHTHIRMRSDVSCGNNHYIHSVTRTAMCITQEPTSIVGRCRLDSLTHNSSDNQTSNHNVTGAVESAPDVYQDAMNLYEVLLETDANIHATLDTDDDQVLLNQAKQSSQTRQSTFAASRLSTAVNAHRHVMQHHILRQQTSRARLDKADVAMHQRARTRLQHTHADSFQSRINRQLAQHTLDNAPWYLRFDAPIAFGGLMVDTSAHVVLDPLSGQPVGSFVFSGLVHVMSTKADSLDMQTLRNSSVEHFWLSVVDVLDPIRRFFSDPRIKKAPQTDSNSTDSAQDNALFDTFSQRLNAVNCHFLAASQQQQCDSLLVRAKVLRDFAWNPLQFIAQETERRGSTCMELLISGKLDASIDDAQHVRVDAKLSFNLFAQLESDQVVFTSIPLAALPAMAITEMVRDSMSVLQQVENVLN